MARRSKAELEAANLQQRKRGEGTVFELANRPGVFRAVRVIEINGKSVQISGTGATAEQAILRREQNVLKKFAGKPAGKAQSKAFQQAVISTGKLSPSSTLHEVMIDWLEWRRYQTTPSKKISAAVRKQYETHIRLHLGPSTLGQMKIDEITRADIENYFFRELPRNTKRVVRDGAEIDVPQLSISNQRAQQSIVNMALNYAVYPLGLIRTNPAFGMERIPKEDYATANSDLESKRKMAYKLAMLLDGRHDEARWLLQLLTGARQSEILGATWSDSFMYLLERNNPAKPPRFIIQQQLVRDPYGDGLKIVKRTKSKSSTRVIPLDDRLVDVLLLHKARQQEIIAAHRDHPDPKLRWNPPAGMEDLVFCELPTGRPTSHQRDHKRWKALLARFESELDGDVINMHGLRHLAASLLATTPGVSLEQIRQILGHGSTAVTSAVYLHISAQNLVTPMTNFTTAVFRDRDANRRGLPVQPYSDDEYFEVNQ